MDDLNKEDRRREEIHLEEWECSMMEMTSLVVEALEALQCFNKCRWVEEEVDLAHFSSSHPREEEWAEA